MRPSIDGRSSPPHVDQCVCCGHNRSPYREAVVLPDKGVAGCCHVYTGLPKELKLEQEVPPGTRLTVRMPFVGTKQRTAKAVAPREPREEAGLYWGYTVRVADNLSAVWSECPFEDGYDCSVGTSEHGTCNLGDASFALPTFNHLLIVFGGVEGLEPVVASEEVRMRGLLSPRQGHICPCPTLCKEIPHEECPRCIVPHPPPRASQC